MSSARTKIIACNTVINELRPFMPPEVEYRAVESGLHLHPEKLRSTLQDLIDEITADTRTIVLGYGLCSMGVIGLSASDSTLVVPRRDDCIAVFLGPRERYLDVLAEEPGTYFLSRGWIEAGITILDDMEKMRERYGRRRADLVTKRMFQHYRRLAFIDMDQGDQAEHREFSRRAARELDLAYQEIKGSPDLLKKLCNGPWDDDFVVVPPGRKIRLEDFGMISSGGRTKNPG